MNIEIEIQYIFIKRNIYSLQNKLTNRPTECTFCEMIFTFRILLSSADLLNTLLYVLRCVT